MFWNKILTVESILKKHEIYINRGIITYIDSIKLLGDTNVDMENGLDVLGQIILIEENPTRGYLAN